ncbi:MAG: UTP--glucose-1-phosphate uridylyltransferase [Verrucomicrobia bacterium]|nr:UTP--glucose-1-phosphate uridylyltransferase [Verrucomicrobiota bacterium]
MNEDAVLSHLAQLRQKHLLAGYERLPQEKKTQFGQQVRKYDRTLLKRQHDLLFSKTSPQHPFEPVQNYSRAGSDADRALGVELVRQGKVACLILAGGQGSRLGVNGPKGAVSVSPIKGKSLFQLFSERSRSASLRAGRPLHLAIMTSPLNHDATKEFFEAHRNFNLPSSHLHFFEQSVLPFCDDRGNWLLERPGKLAEGPDGNGNALHLLYRTGLYDQWRADGVEYVNVILVDNPLADPFDAELIGFHCCKQADAIVKTVPRASANEKMGVVVSREGKTCVVEYSELSDADRLALNSDGTPRFSIANTSLFSFHTDFIKQIATDPECVLPLHLARKQAPVLLGTAQGSCIELAKVWKYETFIFDLLPFARRVEVLLYPRDLSYAPLKNASGEKSLQTVQEALLAFDRHIYSTLSGLPSPPTPFELHPSFYYPTPDLAAQWKGKELPSVAYVE